MKTKLFFNLILLVVLFVPSLVAAQTNEFTYQGRLTDGSMPANASYDFQFALYAVPSGLGVPLGTRERLGVPVSNGAFTVRLDFPATNFDGSDRWLEIRVKPAGSGSGYTPLTPRQQITSSPYAVRSANATNADNATTATNSTQLGGVNANEFIQRNDPRLTDARDPLPGSNDYIRNGTFGQTANLNITGFGVIGGNLTVNGTLTANLPSGDSSYVQNRTTAQTSTNFNISGTGTANVFNAATQFNLGGSRVLSNAGTDNLFAGVNAGTFNTGAANSFFGRHAGASNTTGGNNSFIGTRAGGSNTTGSENSFVGTSAGNQNTTGSSNSFVGTNAGRENGTGGLNSFFGAGAGYANLTGNNNSFVGAGAGGSNTTGSENSFVGKGAGNSNRTGDGNSFFGRSAGDSNTGGSANSFFGASAGKSNTTGGGNAFFGTGAGFSNTTGNRNSFFGESAGGSYTTGFDNTIIGASADVMGENLSYATAIGAGARVSSSNTIALGRPDGADRVLVYGLLDLQTIGTTGILSLCRNFDGHVSNCSSSLRYKTNIVPFNFGLNLVNRLKPITFNWKDGGMADLGLGAEDVAAIEPLLVTYNKDGQVEGVKYDRIGVVLLNAVKEQQTQIEQQQKQLEQQQLLIDGLRKLVCQNNPQADVCKEEQDEK